MTDKIRVLLVGLALIAAFAAGEIKGQRDKESETDTSKQKDHEVITIIEEPNGKKTKTIIRDRIKEDTKTIVKEVGNKPKVNVSLLAGVDSLSRLNNPTYGISFNKEFIGPITIGAFGMTNGLIGVSVGMSF